MLPNLQIRICHCLERKKRGRQLNEVSRAKSAGETVNLKEETEKFTGRRSMWMRHAPAQGEAIEDVDQVQKYGKAGGEAGVGKEIKE